MAQLGTSPNIEIFTRSSVLDVRQEDSDFYLRIKTNPRYVSPEKCIGCGLCEKVCPINVTDKSYIHDTYRKAIYLPSPNAIPRGYVIDGKNCAFFTNGTCRKCEKICPRGAIDLDQAAQEFEVNTQAVVLSPGAKPFDPTILPSYRYGQSKHVITGLEMEVLLSPSGIGWESLKRQRPEKIAWIQCVGSRQTNIVDRPFCSSICCMAAIKQALSIRQNLSPPPETSIFYIDIRSHQKGAERYLRQAIQAGVRLIPSKIHCLEEIDSGRLKIMAWTGAGSKLEEIFDMVVLSCGLGMDGDLNRLSNLFGIKTTGFGFSSATGLEVTRTNKPGIYTCGTYTDPKSIQGAVIEGSAAAALLGSDLKITAHRRHGHSEKKVNAPKLDSGMDRPRIGVFICACGRNIGQVIDIKALVHQVKTINGVIVARHMPFACTPDALQSLSTTIRTKRLNRIVIAACSPKSHEQLFKKAMKEAGLNSNLLEIANIREQAAWVHSSDPKGATNRAMDQIQMSIAKAALLAPIDIPRFPVTKHALIIGGGISGLTAARILSERDITVSLLEKSPVLGGNARALLKSWRGVDISTYLDDLIKEVTSKKNINIFMEADLLDTQGETGNLTSFVRSGSQGIVKAIHHGAVIVASGAKEARPIGFGYGRHPNVLTHQELDERIMRGGLEFLDDAKTVVFIQCVGSCNDERPYCSRVCCTHSVTRALLLKAYKKDLSIYILYRHMRTYGQRDDFYNRAREKGIKAIRFEDASPPEVRFLTRLDQDTRPQTIININTHDPLTGDMIEINPDYLILASAIEPDMANQQALSNKLKVPLDQDGFFQEAHAKLRPVELRRDGFFVAGLAHYPKEVEESISQAAAAAGKAAVFLSKDSVSPDRITAEIIISRCDGCALCLDVCHEKAIKLVEYVNLDEVKKIVEIDPSLCSGCGACTSSCPQYAIGIPGFMPEQILAQIKSLISTKQNENST